MNNKYIKYNQDNQKEKLERFKLEEKAAKNEAMTPDEIANLSRARRKDSLNQILRVCGLITATLMFWYLWDLFADISLFGLIFRNDGFTKFWDFITTSNQGIRLFGPVLDKGVDIAVGVTVTTTIWIGGILLYGLLITYSVRDFVLIIRRFFRGTSRVLEEAKQNLKEVSIEKKDTKKKQSKKNEDLDLYKPVLSKAVKEIKNERRKESTLPAADTGSLTSEELNALLTSDKINIPLKDDENQHGSLIKDEDIKF